MRPRFFILAATLAAFAYACGGADPILVGGDGGESGDDDSSAGRRDAGSKDASISGGDAGRGDGGGDRDSGSDGGRFDGGGFDAGFDAGEHPHNTGILPAECGDVGDGGLLTCNSGAPTCCADQESDILFGASTTYTCTTNPASCAVDAGVIAVMCRDDRDCPGTKICCGELGASVYDTIGCVDATACQTTDANARRFCSPGEWDPCPALGETCMQSGIVFGFNICE